MYEGRRRPETVSKKKRSVFLLMEKCFFLTYFLIGAFGGSRPSGSEYRGPVRLSLILFNRGQQRPGLRVILTCGPSLRIPLFPQGFCIFPAESRQCASYP